MINEKYKKGKLLKATEAWDLLKTSGLFIQSDYLGNDVVFKFEDGGFFFLLPFGDCWSKCNNVHPDFEKPFYKVEPKIQSVDISESLERLGEVLINGDLYQVVSWSRNSGISSFRGGYHSAPNARIELVRK